MSSTEQASPSTAAFHRVVADGTRTLLLAAGLDPDSAQLKDTPSRVAKAWRERLAGYAQDPAEVLGRTFPSEGYDEMIVLGGIGFHSTCEHHLLPFSGTATVGYIPDPTSKRIVGLSKLARLVDLYANRLQVQERMTRQVADALAQHLAPVGIGVLVQAAHSCMACRGIRKPGVMTTSVLVGAMREDAAVRAEFLALALQHGGKL